MPSWHDVDATPQVHGPLIEGLKVGNLVIGMVWFLPNSNLVFSLPFKFFPTNQMMFVKKLVWIERERMSQACVWCGCDALKKAAKHGHIYILSQKPWHEGVGEQDRRPPEGLWTISKAQTRPSSYLRTTLQGRKRALSVKRNLFCILLDYMFSYWYLFGACSVPCSQCSNP